MAAQVPALCPASAWPLLESEHHRLRGMGADQAEKLNASEVLCTAHSGLPGIGTFTSMFVPVGAAGPGHQVPP